MPGTKLAEQQLADIFSVSRTLVRQALNQLSRDGLVTLEPSRGAFVAQPGIDEARQVFEVRRMLEAAMVRRLCGCITDAQVAALRAHLKAEATATNRSDVRGRTRLLADFHTVLAKMLGNEVLARMLARSAVAQFADRADVPVVASAAHSHERACGDRRRPGAARCPRRGAPARVASGQRRA